ncbi:MAG TPA: ABC transporter ATP-binding protein [Pyrinomonadaceae bacterium]|jgi:ABC-type polysaccharide/polyol phosphate transport system ATPase subunit|nr:ABC transporter ATP-binding protein [Pyrinomonadaceae bacterium]
MPPAIRVESVSKQYRIYDRPVDRLKESLTRGRWKTHREFWALNNISFEVESGTTTGIIGPNGSGKSTLLQIITGTLEPTHGAVWYEGRIAALLELGAGFNAEFTGIENVFMNATLMGLSTAKTERLLPEIASFAEIGDFIYQPVKTYSSGMYVRLAFATAIAASPQILIIDEALAVGDAVFQHRCMRRIKEMQENGATILFVSHDPSAIRALCNHAILLNHGRMAAEGTPSEVLNRYRKTIMARQQAYEANRQPIDQSPTANDDLEYTPTPLSYTYRHGDRSAEVLQVDLLNTALHPTNLVETGEPLIVRIVYVAHEDLDDVICGFLIRNRHCIHIYGTNTELQELPLERVKRGELTEVTFEFNCWIAPDLFSLCVAVHSRAGVSFDWLDGCLFFRVMSATPMEGVTNLNATATSKRLAGIVGKESVTP